jgi:3-methylfumaryl-CoA hydratase
MSEAYKEWIGRSVVREDIATPRLAAEYRATLSPRLFETDDVAVCPPGFHWALAPAIPLSGNTSHDGSERKGEFLPPIPLPRRMWAGGTVETLKPIRIGNAIRRTSTVADIKYREGRAGRLYVVSVRHDIEADGETAVIERQDLVFREGAPKAVLEASLPPPAGARTWTVDATPLLLFRFSAFTFNGHRIHYDAHYAAEEGYPGLVVHGPMQAALMLNMASVSLGHVPQHFDYRCVAPLFSGHEFTVAADQVEPVPHVRIIRHDGVTTAEAQVHVRETGSA